MDPASANADDPPSYTLDEKKNILADFTVPTGHAVPITIIQYARGQRGSSGCSQPYRPSLVQGVEDVISLTKDTTWESFSVQLWKQVLYSYPAFLNERTQPEYDLGLTASYKTSSGIDPDHNVTRESFRGFLHILQTKQVDSLTLEAHFFPSADLVKASKEPIEVLNEALEKTKDARKERSCIMM